MQHRFLVYGHSDRQNDLLGLTETVADCANCEMVKPPLNPNNELIRNHHADEE